MSPRSPIAIKLRGVMIAYGVAFFWWWFSSSLPQAEGSEWTPGSLYMIALGLALQLAAWITRRLVARYEREHGMEGMLVPAVVEIGGVIIDAATVLLFAIATFRAIAFLPSNI